MNRNESIVAVRPTVQKESTEFSNEELFQNDVLRPILKFQHELLLQEWEENPLFLSIKKADTIEERRKLMALLFSKQPPFLQRLVGMTVGLLTKEEFQFYLKEKALLDKRIKDLLITRLLSCDTAPRPYQKLQ
jgi:hypothetical protein